MLVITTRAFRCHISQCSGDGSCCGSWLVKSTWIVDGILSICHVWVDMVLKSRARFRRCKVLRRTPLSVSCPLLPRSSMFQARLLWSRCLSHLGPKHIFRESRDTRQVGRLHAEWRCVISAAKKQSRMSAMVSTAISFESPSASNLWTINISGSEYAAISDVAV